MPVARFQMEDGRVARFQVPDGTTPEQAQSMMKEHFSKGDSLELSKEPSALENFGSGVKKAFTDLGQGIGQVAGVTSREDVANTRAKDAELMDTTSGRFGHFMGSAAAAIPAAFIPGVNTAVGGALVGAGLGAIQPSTSDSETLGNTGFGALGGAIGAKISQFLDARAARRAARSANIAPTVAAKNADLSAAQKSGYVVPPQDAGAGPGSQVLNAISGKIKTEQKASVLNQSVTNSKAAKSIGLPEHDPITLDAIDAVRKKAGLAYEAIRGTGTIKTDKQFRVDLRDIENRYQSAAKDFPGLLNENVSKVVSAVNKKEFDADSAIDAIGILRKSADKAYRGGDHELGAATKKAADALESAIGRHLQATGAPQGIVNDFQNARQLIAKTYTVEKALNKGSGSVNAAKIAAQADKKPLTGDLSDIAKFAKSYPKANQELQGVNPFSVLDAAGAVGGAAINPAITAYVGARPIVRNMVLSPTYQRMFVKQGTPSNTLTSVMRLGSKAATPLSALAGIKSQEEK